MTEISVCSTCGDLAQFSIEGKWQDLQTTAKTGCEACAMLMRGIQLFDIDTERAVNFWIHVDLTLYLNLTSEDNQPEPLNVTLEFYTEEGHISRWRKIGPGRHVAKNLRDHQSVALMKTWLSECLQTHSACRRETSSQLPTRLIAVGASNEELYLHVPDAKERSEYVALSHCWGLHRPLVTNQASLKEHQKHLKLDESSKLFTEAVELARTLGFPYIWIDSLCIIQDSAEDWSREAGNMTTVFNNATLTLFAHVSRDSSYSLYPDASSRNLSIALPVVNNVKNKQEIENIYGAIFVREIYKYPHQLASSHHSGRAPETSFLASRGWVLQEELLSPRSLNFYAEEMSWTCSTYSRCECRIRPNVPLPSFYRDAPTKSDRHVPGSDDLQGEPTNQDKAAHPDVQHQFKLSNPTDRGGDTTADLLADWPDVVAEFSHRLLTVPSDKLPALTGLAGYIQKVSPNEKFAGGLWLSDLSFQLLWSRDHTFESQQISGMADEAKTERQSLEMQTYTSRHLHAATWSWLSLPKHAAIHYPTRHMTRSPMKRSHDYARHSKKSVDHSSHFVKPLFGNSDFINILDIHVWVQKMVINSWGPGLLTLACRCIYISVSRETACSNESDEKSSDDSENGTQDCEASATYLSLSLVDHFGQKGGSWPSGIDLASFKFDWDSPVFQEETKDTLTWTIDTRLTQGHVDVINKWKDYRHAHDDVDQPTDSVQDAPSSSVPPIARQDKETNMVKSSTNAESEKSDEQEKSASRSLPVNGTRTRTFALMLAGVMTWVYNFTPKRVEGVCLVLEPVNEANSVYRRVGHVTGVGSAEAWMKDVPKRVIHIV